MRKCKGRYYDSGLFVEFELGYFHQWGCNYEEFENGAGNYSVAIVELPNGKVVTPLANDIEFLEPDVTNRKSRKIKKSHRRRISWKN